MYTCNTLFTYLEGLKACILEINMDLSTTCHKFLEYPVHANVVQKIAMGT